MRSTQSIAQPLRLSSVPGCGDFDPDIPRDWEAWYCELDGEDDGYALLPPGNSQAKTISNVKTLLATFHADTYDQAKEKFTELCAAHNAARFDFVPEDTGLPAWVVCDCCQDYLCQVHHGKHVHECECPALECWIAVGIDPYLTGGLEYEESQGDA